MKHLLLPPLLLLALLYLSACFSAAEIDDVVNDAPNFPTLLAEEAEQMEALLTGKLVFRNRCFRVVSEEGSAIYTPIWPAGYDYQLEADSVFIILNAAGNEVARTGVGIRLSGGAISDPQMLEGRLEEGLPKLLLSCPAPFWVAGSEISVHEPETELAAETQYRLQDWFEFYRPHIDDWRLVAFEIEESWQIDSLRKMPTENIYPLADRPNAWLINSPNERYNLDLYARNLVVNTAANGRREVFALSPDSEAALEDQLRGERYRLLFCGTPCRFETGYWQNEQTLVIAGLHQGGKEQFHPTIWKINIRNRTVKQYSYPTPLMTPFPYNYVQERIFSNG